MSDDKKISLELGDIIRIKASSNDEIHDKIFLIIYLDENIVTIENDDTTVPIVLNLKKGTFQDESIENIELLSRSTEKGFSRQNGLVPGKWVSINFGGDLPITINGLITNLEDDMIELNTYPSKDTLYINFDYKGIPLELPITSFHEIKAPMSSKEEPEQETEEEDEEEVFNEEEDFDIIDAQQFVPDEKINEELIQNIILGDEIIFGDDLGEIEEFVNVEDTEKRFSLIEQKTDLLDSLLSDVPNIERTTQLLNYFHKIVERYSELRNMYSVFDKIGTITGFKINDKKNKSIIEYLDNLNKDFNWIIPVVKNKKKIYNIDVDMDDIDTLNKVSMTEDSKDLQEYLNQLSMYNKNEVPEGMNKYYVFMERIMTLFNPHEIVTDKMDIIKEGYINKEVDVVLDNLGNFESYIVVGTDKSSVISRYKFLRQRYAKGLTKTFLVDKFSKNYLVEQMTKNDKVSITGLIILPLPFVNISKINLEKSSILERANLNKVNINYNEILKNVIVKKTIRDDDSYDQDSTFLEEILYYNMNTDIHYDDRGVDFYSNFLNKIIPSNKDFFHKIKSSIKNKHSYYEIVRALEPFGIYESSIGFMLYKDIIIFMEENNLELKKKMAKNIQIFSNYLSNISTIKSKTGLFKILLDQDEDILQKYNINSNLNSEILEKIYLMDNGAYLFDVISQLNISLINDVDVDIIIEDIVSKENKSKGCTPLILAKKYIALEDLEEDDKNEIYFDKKFDETRYSIMDEFKSEKGRMNGEELAEFLTNHFVNVVGMNEETAIRESAALVIGKKTVIDGDYAMLDILDEGIRYYERKNQAWNYVDEFDDKNQDTILEFCNLQDKCLKINESCNGDNENKKKIVEKLSNEIREHFENELTKSTEELVNEIKLNKEISYKRLLVLIKFGDIEKYKNNLYYNSIAEELVDTENISSPLVSLRDIILGETDFIKKNTYIIKFVNKFCRLKLGNNTDENDFWYYCVSTNLPLLPTYFYNLAHIAINNLGSMSVNYAIEVDKIAAERGALSADGDKVVDKHSGYVIKYKEASNVEGYTESGYKVVSRDIMDDDGNDFMNQVTVIVDPKYKSPRAKQINDIIDSFNKEIGISLNEEYVILIIKNVNAQLKMIQSFDEYEIFTKKLVEKNEKVKSYDFYFDETFILSIMVYYSLAIQISIPHIVEGIPFRGCSESFIGFPITDNGDMSLLNYIICVAYGIKNSGKRPWNSLQTSRKPEKMNKIKLSILNKMVTMLKDIALQNDEIINLVEKKKEFLVDNFSDVVLTDNADLKNWCTFLPIMGDTTPKAVRVVSAGFKTGLMNDIRDGNIEQIDKIFSLKSKIREFSIAVQHSIKKSIQNEELLLTNNATVPYLENSCCYTEGVSPLEFMISKDASILTNNNIVLGYEEILNNIRRLSRAQKMLSLTNMKFVYPIITDSYSEKTIYAGFIKHCLFFSKTEIPTEEIISFMRENGIVIQKLENAESLDKPEEVLNDNILHMKEKGYDFTQNGLMKLLNVVNKKNILQTSFEEEVLTSRKIFEDNINDLQEDEEFLCSGEIINLLKEITDTFDVESKKLNSFSVSNLLDQHNNSLQNQIFSFFEEKNIERIKSTKKDNVITFLKNFLDWKSTGDDILCSNEDETGFKVGLVLKNMIFSILKIFPSIVIKECSYENKYPPVHWNLDPFHNKSITNNIHKEYEGFNQFFGNKDLNLILENIIKESEIILKFVDSIPIFMGIDEDTILNGTIYKKILFNMFLCSIKLYISLAKSLEMNNDLDQSFLITESERDEIKRSTVDKRLKNVGNLLKVYLNIFNVHKSKVLNFSNEDIKYKILKAKEKEKEKIKTRLKNMTIEEREVEDYLKTHRLGKWNKGQTKGLYMYQKDRYLNEMNELLTDFEGELRSGTVDEVTESIRENYGLDFAEIENRYLVQEEQEIYSMAHIFDDDDTGEADGDEDF